MISRGLIAMTPLWHFLCKRQCDYPKSIVPGFHTGKQLKFTRNQIGKEYTTKHRTTKIKTDPILPAHGPYDQNKSRFKLSNSARKNKRGNRSDGYEQQVHCSHPKKLSKYLWHETDDSQRISLHLSDVWQGIVKQNITLRKILNCNTSIQINLI